MPWTNISLRSPPRRSSPQPRDAIRLGAISFDAVKQLFIAKVEHRPANLDPGHYPYLPAANVKTTSAADYMVLVSGRAAL